MQTKKCSRCRKVKGLEEFNKKRSRRDGRQAYCKICQRRTQTDWYQKNKRRIRPKIREANRDRRERNREYVYNVLKRTECADCGEKNLVVLDFDHVNGEKVDSISRLVGGKYSIKRIKEEIRKCEVVCANCHRKREAKRDSRHWIHTYASVD